MAISCEELTNEAVEVRVVVHGEVAGSPKGEAAAIPHVPFIAAEVHNEPCNR
jgi:hypothetical protein